MFRFMVALALFWMMLPAQGSVSLGEIDIRSFLNQPLDAQIRMEGPSVDDPALTIRVAPEEDYRRVGLTRGAIPPDLTITIDGSSDRRIVRLATQRPVREPYVGLLLEARWSGGRTLREYTLLLDPPVAFAPVRSAPPVLSPAPAPAVAAAPPPPVATTVPAALPRSGVYRVSRGDTLLGIVRGAGYTGVTDQQAMLAILEANPDGFIDRNINRMRADVTLVLPSEAEVAQRSPVAARQEVERQTSAWRAQVAPAPPPPTVVLVPAEAPPPIETPTPEEIPSETPVEPVTPPDEPPVAIEPRPEGEPEMPAVTLPEQALVEQPLVEAEGIPEDRLEILGERAADLDAAPTPASARILEEALLSQQGAMDALRDELISLRTELAERDQLLTVVSTELAQLEGRMRALQDQTSPAGGVAFGERPLHERILADPLLLIMVATLLVLLLLLVWALFRRPREREFVATRTDDSFNRMATPRAEPGRTEPVERGISGRSAAFAGVATGAAAMAASHKEAEAAETTSANAPRNVDDDTPVAVSVGQGADEDVLADVDLYLAYGMNEQAISALEHAINEGHDSLVYRVRLLEAHGANDDTDVVLQQAAALRAELGPEDREWLKRIAVVESLVSRPGDAAARDDSDATNVAEAVGDRAASGTSKNTEPEAFSVASPADPGVMEFETSDFSMLGSVAPEDDRSAKTTDAAEDANLMQFNLDDLEIPSDTPGAPTGGPTNDAGETGDVDLPPLVFPDIGKPSPGSESVSGATGSPNVEPDFSETGMKLNLAEAFAEMGDREGALSLLDELGSSGTAEQLAKMAEIRSKLDKG